MTQQKLANPGPLGLLGFGMTTILLNVHNAGLLPLSIMIIGMGFAMGGLAQIIAGIFEMKQGNTFAGTAFIAYGCFWWSLVVIWTMAPEGLAADKIAMGFYLSIWGLFTAFMFVGTLTHNKATQVVFGSLTLLFALLALGDFLSNPAITLLAGVVGIFCGFSAFYSAVAQIVNGEHQKTIFPL